MIIFGMSISVDLFAVCLYLFIYHFFIVFEVLNFEHMDLEIAQEVIVRSKKPRKRKNTTSKVLKGLITCLFAKEYSHMLKWVDISKRRFEVKLVNKLSNRWERKDIILFEFLDSLQSKVRTKVKYEENAKNRFKANMTKLSKYIKEVLPPRKESKSVTFRTYEIFYLPKNEELEFEKLMKSSENQVENNIDVYDMEGNESFEENSINSFNTTAEDSNIPNNALQAAQVNTDNISLNGNQENYLAENKEENNMGRNRATLTAFDENSNYIFDTSVEDSNIPNNVLQTAQVNTYYGSLNSDEGNFDFSELGEIVKNNMGGNIATLTNLDEDPIYFFDTSVEDFNIPNNALQTAQVNTYYGFLNSDEGNFYSSENEDKNFKEKNGVLLKTLNEDGVFPFNTFVTEDLKFQSGFQTFERNPDYSLQIPYEKNIFSGDYEGNMEFESLNNENISAENFQYPTVKINYVDASNYHGLPSFDEFRNSRM